MGKCKEGVRGIHHAVLCGAMISPYMYYDFRFPLRYGTTSRGSWNKDSPRQSSADCHMVLRRPLCSCYHRRPRKSTSVRIMCTSIALYIILLITLLSFALVPCWSYVCVQEAGGWIDDRLRAPVTPPQDLLAFLTGLFHCDSIIHRQTSDIDLTQNIKVTCNIAKR
jgi:hypothetical protein